MPTNFECASYCKELKGGRCRAWRSAPSNLDSAFNEKDLKAGRCRAWRPSLIKTALHMKEQLKPERLPRMAARAQ